MQQKILFFVLLFSSIASGQITYEHTYYNGFASRIVLENSGEKYYLVDFTNHKIDFYNANHTFWKSIVLPISENYYSIGISNISENKLNNDNLLEIVYSTYSAPNIRQSKIINEEGTVLLTVDNCYSLTIDEKQGLPTKIISYSSTESNIYSVPELLLEHTYASNETKRIIFENAGEKYYNFNPTTGIVTIYNNDHTFWKNITLTKPDDYIFSGISFLSENQINDDNLLEIGYGYYGIGENQIYQSKIINEEGITLLSLDNVRYIDISDIDGLAKKLIAYTTTNLSQIYSCPSLVLEHTYDGSIERVKLEISGEKYYDNKIYSINSNVPVVAETIIYNSNHTLWKTITTPIQFSEFGSIISVHASETKFNSDNLVELAYSCYSNTLDGGHYESNIINENGTVLLNIPGASSIFLSEIPNLSKKLITNIYYNISFDNIQYSSKIYGFDGPTVGVEDFNLMQITISPNPASSYLEFKAENSIIKKVVVYDLQGKIIQKFENDNIKKIDIQKFDAGLYIARLTDENNKSYTYKFIKN
ncbi:MAG: T9SS type A sorting domain-containing protein [Flavobacterium sp.]|uniref:T9SS type A sorting domain-containing protein n=1 Tax=Flavobacterium sp. TaxID=239 RepID=UPI0022BB9F05|nr:T9SS type A sorting domain-containing protein [Flavobacterium sp.]MCZ8197032.1 T9SS type A sorting domain-containing protein [Flavobacterium sp.]